MPLYLPANTDGTLSQYHVDTLTTGTTLLFIGTLLDVRFTEVEYVFETLLQVIFPTPIRKLFVPFVKSVPLV